MKKTFIILLVTISSYSQSISKQVIGASGKTLINSNSKISYTVGEPIVGLMTASGNQLGNGYYPSLDLQTLIVEDNVLDVQIKVYPNPTSQMLYVTHSKINSFGITIVDLNGKLLFQNTIFKDVPLDISNYTQGMYLITIENEQTKNINTYKIIKR